MWTGRAQKGGMEERRRRPCTRCVTNCSDILPVEESWRRSGGGGGGEGEGEKGSRVSNC